MPSSLSKNGGLTLFVTREDHTISLVLFLPVFIIKNLKLELMFMKHYAPNRCLYIKVTKLKTGLGSAEMSHLQNCSLKIYLKITGGSGWGVGVRMDGCERRIEVFVIIQKKNWGVGPGGSGWGSGWM